MLLPKINVAVKNGVLTPSFTAVFLQTHFLRIINISFSVAGEFAVFDFGFAAYYGYAPLLAVFDRAFADGEIALSHQGYAVVFFGFVYLAAADGACCLV